MSLGDDVKSRRSCPAVEPSLAVDAVWTVRPHTLVQVCLDWRAAEGMEFETPVQNNSPA